MSSAILRSYNSDLSNNYGCNNHDSNFDLLYQGIIIGLFMCACKYFDILLSTWYRLGSLVRYQISGYFRDSFRRIITLREWIWNTALHCCYWEKAVLAASWNWIKIEWSLRISDCPLCFLLLWAHIKNVCFSFRDVSIWFV